VVIKAALADAGLRASELDGVEWWISYASYFSPRGCG